MIGGGPSLCSSTMVNSNIYLLILIPPFKCLAWLGGYSFHYRTNGEPFRSYTIAWVPKITSIPHLAWFLFFQTEVNGTIMKKKTITFIMKGPSIFSELRFAQSQYHTKNNDSSITMGRRITDRFIGGVASTHFSILACIDSSSMISTSCLC